MEMRFKCSFRPSLPPSRLLPPLDPLIFMRAHTLIARPRLLTALFYYLRSLHHVLSALRRARSWSLSPLRCPLSLILIPPTPRLTAVRYVPIAPTHAPSWSASSSTSALHSHLFSLLRLFFSFYAPRSRPSRSTNSQSTTHSSSACLRGSATYPRRKASCPPRIRLRVQPPHPPHGHAYPETQARARSRTSSASWTS
ncbi:hypothetical protein C8J57DRAFT_1381739 [Mycena rebaudengoi]|nr:hypothetical protein C8J57DRAFT_1381739 [Mycena rebaudengoi]